MATGRFIAPDELEAPGPKGPLPPYRCVRDFLAVDERNYLLHFSIANEALFQPTTIHNGVVEVVNSQQRVSVGLRDFGPAENILRARMTALVPQLIADLRVRSFVPSKVELELVAH